MYFTGTRELWNDRNHINSLMLDMAKKGADWRTCGIIIANGIVWPLTHNGEYAKAHSTLSISLEDFSKTKTPADKIVYYDSLAELHEESGHPSDAVDHYNTALELAKSARHDVQESKILYKRNFARVKSDPSASSSKIVALEQLRDNFSAIKSFREAIVNLEIAKTLHQLASDGWQPETGEKR